MAEAIQTILHREGYPIRKAQELNRTKERPGAAEFKKFIKGLDVDPAVRDELHQITPMNYLASGSVPSEPYYTWASRVFGVKTLEILKPK